MEQDEKMVPLAEAEAAVNSMSRRLGMLHLAFARTLRDAFGEEQAKELIRKAIWAYGTQVGNETRARVEAQGLEPTPENFKYGSDLSPIGFKKATIQVGDEKASHAVGCEIAKVWIEAGEQALGGLYCLVDPAKMQAYNPGYTMVHLKREPEGDDCCDIVVREVEETGKYPF